MKTETGKSGDNPVADLSTTGLRYPQNPQNFRLEEARTLVDQAIKSPEQRAEFATKLAELNQVDPGILSKALTHDSLLERNIGQQMGGFAPWVPVVGPKECLATSNFVCHEMEESWQESLEGGYQKSVEALIADFKVAIQSKNTNFSDNPKIHLESARADGETLHFETRPAWYSDNAAISHVIGNALYDLAREDKGERDLEADSAQIEKVLDLLGQLGLTPGDEGIDFSLGNSPLPHTLGVSGVVLTSDGYLIQALQGSKNMASGGDFVPAISGSADPVEGSKANFHPLSDFFREAEEEQGAVESSVAFCGVAGVYQSIHRLGKPDVVLVAVSKDSLLEFLQKKEQGNSQGESWELKKEIAEATYVGMPQLGGFHEELGDKLQSDSKIASQSPRVDITNPGMSIGSLDISLDAAAQSALLGRYKHSGYINHVNQLALFGAVEYMKALSQD